MGVGAKSSRSPVERSETLAGTDAGGLAAAAAAAASPPRAGRRVGPAAHGLLAAFCALLWVGCLVLYTRANTFAYYYHPDEEGKAKQATLGSRNFNHPQMLLEVSSVAIRAAG